MISNPEHIKILLEEPLKILPFFIKNKQFNSWPEKSYFIRENISQDIIKSAYLILTGELEKIHECVDKDHNSLLNKYLDDLEIFWCALTDENAAKIELAVRN